MLASICGHFDNRLIPCLLLSFVAFGNLVLGRQATRLDARLNTRLDARVGTRLDARLDARLDTRLDTRLDLEARLDSRLDARLDARDWRSSGLFTVSVTGLGLRYLKEQILGTILRRLGTWCLVGAILAWILDWMLDWMFAWMLAWILAWILDSMLDWMLAWILTWMLAWIQCFDVSGRHTLRYLASSVPYFFDASIASTLGSILEARSVLGRFDPRSILGSDACFDLWSFRSSLDPLLASIIRRF
jgi:hypothetical protein